MNTSTRRSSKTIDINAHTADAWEAHFAAYCAAASAMDAAYRTGGGSGRMLRAKALKVWETMNAWCVKHGETNPVARSAVTA
jgi:hypothetical protein